MNVGGLEVLLNLQAVPRGKALLSAVYIWKIID